MILFTEKSKEDFNITDLVPRQLYAFLWTLMIENTAELTKMNTNDPFLHYKNDKNHLTDTRS